MNTKPPIEQVIAATLVSFFRINEKWGFMVVENDRTHQFATPEYQANFTIRVENLLIDIVSGMGGNLAEIDIRELAKQLAPRLMRSRLRSHEELRSAMNRG